MKTHCERDTFKQSFSLNKLYSNNYIAITVIYVHYFKPCKVTCHFDNHANTSNCQCKSHRSSSSLESSWFKIMKKNHWDGDIFEHSFKP